MLNKRNILIAIIVALVTAYYSFVTSVAPNYIKQFIPVAETMAQDYIHGTVKIGDVKWQGGLSQHARPPCPSPTPRVHSDSRPSNQ